MGYTPRRVVSLQPSATVILRELGKLDVLVACTKYCVDICPEIRERQLTIVADSWTAQSQPIRKTQADLVIASVPYQEKAVIEILKAGVPFLALAPRTLADIYTDIALIARVVDAMDTGECVIKRMQDEITAVREQTRKLPRARVFCEEWGKPLIASQPWVAELVEAAGGEFIGTPGAPIDPGIVRQRSPEVCIAAWCGTGDRVPLDKIVQTRQWTDTPAARNGRIYCIRDEYLNTPAPTLVRGLQALAAAIHPGQFPQPDGLRWIGKSQLVIGQ